MLYQTNIYDVGMTLKIKWPCSDDIDVCVHCSMCMFVYTWKGHQKKKKNKPKTKTKKTKKPQKWK